MERIFPRYLCWFRICCHGSVAKQMPHQIADSSHTISSDCWCFWPPPLGGDSLQRGIGCGVQFPVCTRRHCHSIPHVWNVDPRYQPLWLSESHAVFWSSVSTNRRSRHNNINKSSQRAQTPPRQLHCRRESYKMRIDQCSGEWKTDPRSTSGSVASFQQNFGGRPIPSHLLSSLLSRPP